MRGSGRFSQSEDDNASKRITVSLTEAQYEVLQKIADEKKVSLSWVVRDAVERLSQAESPLFAQDQT